MIREFRANGGRVSGRREEYSLLLLHHTGAKPGVTRANPVAYLGDAGRYVIFAAIGGAPSSRLVPQPQGAAAHENRGGSETIDVVVAEATSEERERLFALQAARYRELADSARKDPSGLPGNRPYAHRERMSSLGHERTQRQAAGHGPSPDVKQRTSPKPQLAGRIAR
jgi:hypothetical protein